MEQVTFTKDDLIRKLRDIKSMGWIANARPGNAGGVGNTLENLLGIKENNLPIPNQAEWELKAQRIGTSSLITLFHMEPSPQALRFVTQVGLLKYGWEHAEAGKKYPSNELSFRQTINASKQSDRGFIVVINKEDRKIQISFDANSVHSNHRIWLESVEKRVGLGELNPQPYWGFDDLFHKAGTKLLNTFYVQAEVKKENGIEYFYYSHIQKLTEFSLNGFLDAFDAGYLYVDFDARSGHNHGTKFRLRQDNRPMLYKNIEIIEE